MESTHDSRKQETAATEKTAVTGGNGTGEPAKAGTPQSGAPRSWRQYIEQTLPARDTEPQGAGVQQSAPGGKKRTGTAWERFARLTARWARENREKARSFAAATREKRCAATATAAARKKLGGAAAVCGQKLSAAAAVCRERLGPVAAACREGLDPITAACRERLGPVAEKVRVAVARHPISPLLYVTLLAVFIGVAAFQGNYARAYVLEVNDQKLGLVSGEDEVNAILNSVELRAASILGDDFDYEVDVTLSPVYAAPGDLTDAAAMEDALFEVVAYVAPPLDDLPEAVAEVEEPTGLAAWAISVDGEEIGYAASKEEFYQMLDEIAQPYLPENAVRYEFLENVQVYPIKLPLDFQFEDLGLIQEELSALRVEKAVYMVKQGDTFNAIAYSLGMQPDDLSALNPDVIVDWLMIDQELIIQQAVPRLSVVALSEETYEEVIPSLIEYIETADLYVGDTKVKTQGEDGLALVSAEVTYINNEEMAREILESTTLKEPTTTYTYTGTTPRPTTASKGYFIWPVRGSISSSYGYRYIFGSTSFHGGIDIVCSYGTTIKAADGGKVTYAGVMGTYGNLVIITHDDGKQTYYAHNSSILVKVGQQVYQGQAIAKAGSTGRATGVHCHFEVRVNGTRVNPRNYLS